VHCVDKNKVNSGLKRFVLVSSITVGEYSCYLIVLPPLFSFLLLLAPVRQVLGNCDFRTFD